MSSFLQKNIMSTAVALLLLSNVFSCQAYSSPNDQSPTLPKLYEISGNGLDTPSYLFGTIHVICPDDFVFPEKALNALKKSKQVIQELDFSCATVTQYFQENMLLANGQDISSFADEPTRLVLASFLEDCLGVGFDQVKRIKPILLLSLFNQYLLSCQPKSYDLYIHERALDTGIKVIPVETPAQQINYLDAIPVEDQIGMLVEMIENQVDAQNNFHLMIQLYLAGETETLQGLLLNLSAGTPELNEKLIIQRNNQWMEALPEMLVKPSFIAVGVGHLYGTHGLVERFRNKGYTVEAI